MLVVHAFQASITTLYAKNRSRDGAGSYLLVVDCCFFSAIMKKNTTSLSKIGNASELLAAMVRDDAHFMGGERRPGGFDCMHAIHTHRLPGRVNDLSLPIFSHCRFSCPVYLRALRASWKFSGTWMAVLSFLRADHPLPATVEDIGVVEMWRRVGMWLGKGTE